MSEKTTHRWILPLALVLVVAGAAVLVISGLRQDSVYFLEVSEALAMGTENLNQARLFGSVEAGSIERDPSALGVGFRILDTEDTGKSITVAYRGAVPDTFKPGVEVIVEGSMRPDDGVFQATTLMTKCPSKYQKQAD
ncbi:MAG: cytochrome c maturation protein CcmE [Desulfovibrionales bacterium]